MKLTKNNLFFRAGVVEGTIFGGRYVEYEPGTRRLAGVKMAEEIKHPHEISIPTRDYDVPSNDDMQYGVQHAINYLSHGVDIYAGCMGGIGRTGLFMGCMAKVLIDYHDGEYGEATDPVAIVRGCYKSHAIETDEQQAFVRGFDTSKAIAQLQALQPVDHSQYISRAAHAHEVRELHAELASAREGYALAAGELYALRNRSFLERVVDVFLPKGLS